MALSLSSPGVTLDVAAFLGSLSTFAADCGTGSNRLALLFLGAHMDNAGDGVSAVTYNSVSMTKISGASVENVFGGVDGEISTWYIINPSSGSNTVSITYSNESGINSGIATFVPLDGAHQTAPLGVDNVSAATSNTHTFTETTETANSWLICGWTWRGGDTAPFSPSDTELSDHVSGANASTDVGQTVVYEATTTAGSYSVGTTATANDAYCGGAVEIKEAGAATVVKDMIGGGIIAFPR